MQVCIYHQ